ncbi:alpha/beta hydrolase [bacterium]|nr:alpha/beta hydrolase [bacterium]
MDSSHPLVSEHNVRLYGSPPYKIAVLHGGPGAPGYMAPVARELAGESGIAEPLQSKDSLRGQIEELKAQLEHHANPPCVLIGSSWGAVLALLAAAEYPHLASKLILVGSAVLDAASSATIEPRRLSRMDTPTRRRFDQIRNELESMEGDRKAELFREWGRMMSETDIYDGSIDDLETSAFQDDIFRSVWPDYTTLRDTPGALSERFSKIDIPVTVIHGDYDPHPIDGIRPFLQSCLRQLSFHLLHNCGHYPWLERQARNRFFEILRADLKHVG